MGLRRLLFGVLLLGLFVIAVVQQVRQPRVIPRTPAKREAVSAKDVEQVNGFVADLSSAQAVATRCNAYVVDDKRVDLAALSRTGFEGWYYRDGGPMASTVAADAERKAKHLDASSACAVAHFLSVDGSKLLSTR